MNQRTNEYGGSLENRTRLMRELIEDVKEAVGQTCAVTIRLGSDELLETPGEIAETLAHEVTLVTPANAVSAWTFMNNEMGDIRRRMIDVGVSTELEQLVTGFSNNTVQLQSTHQESEFSEIECDSLLIVGARTVNDSVYQDLFSDPERSANAGIRSVHCIGDYRAPGTIAHAVYSGHEYARNIDAGGSIPSINWERAKL